MLQVTPENLRRLITNDAPKRTYRMSAAVQGKNSAFFKAAFFKIHSAFFKESRMMLGISQCLTSDTTNSLFSPQDITYQANVLTYRRKMIYGRRLAMRRIT